MDPTNLPNYKKILITVSIWMASSYLQRNEKELESDTNTKNLEPGHSDGMWYRKVKKRNNGKNKTVKSRRIRTLGEKENSKYLGILEIDTIKQAEMGKKWKEYLRRTRKFPEDRPCSRNLIKGYKKITSYPLDGCVPGGREAEDRGRRQDGRTWARDLGTAYQRSD